MMKNGTKNFIYGLFSQFIITALGIIIPRLTLVNLGSEANGLLSSIGNILSYLSLLEAGVGTATLNALFGPIGKGDLYSVNRIMSATDRFYKRTGYIYLVCVIIASILFTLFIDSTLSKFLILTVTLLAGLSSVIAYFFQGKFIILLSAEGKGYITTNISTFISVLTSLGKIVLLLLGYNVLAIQVLHFTLSLIQMCLILIYIKLNYKWIDLSVEPNIDAISQRKAVLVHQISSLIFSNTDVVILTFFCGLKTVSVYSMYVMVFGMVKAITVTFSSSYVYALGQTFEDNPKFIKMYDTYEVYSMAFTSALFCITGILITPFLKLYTSGVNDISYIDNYLPWLFVIFYYLHNGRQSSSNLINIAQKFEATKWRSLLESIINIISSLIMTYLWGVYGVILGTIAALLYRTNDMIIYGSHILKRSCLITYKRWFINIVLLLFFSFITSNLNLDLSNYKNLFIYGSCLCLIIIPSYFIVNSIFEKDVAIYTLKNVNKLFKN